MHEICVLPCLILRDVAGGHYYVLLIIVSSKQEETLLKHVFSLTAIKGSQTCSYLKKQHQLTSGSVMTSQHATVDYFSTAEVFYALLYHLEAKFFQAQVWIEATQSAHCCCRTAVLIQELAVTWPLLLIAS